jgi:L-ascorbate metabolism protein UlaG (beta-lactamase superfamily)
MRVSRGRTRRYRDGMRVTRLQHSTLVLEKDGARLLVDPGNFTPDLGDVSGIVGVVVTHEHPDHWTPEHLATVLAANPGAPVFSTAAVAAAAEVAVTAVSPGDRVEVGPFRLSFHGHDHAIIHASIPRIRNLGVFVDETLYYGGDALVAPELERVPVLATPSGAPWLKIGEVMDYVAAVRPDVAFPMHDAVLAAPGRQLASARLGEAMAAIGGRWVDLRDGDSLDA